MSGTAATRGGLGPGTVLVLLGNGVAMLTSLLLRILMARTMSPAELGLVVLGIAIVSGVGGIAGLGLNTATARRIAMLPDEARASGARAATRTAFALAVVSGVFVAVALFLAAPRLEAVLDKSGLAPVILVLTLVVLTLTVGAASGGVARGHNDVLGRAAIHDSGGGVARLVAVALAVIVGGSVTAIAAGYTIGCVVAETAMLLYAWRRGWLSGVLTASWDGGLLRSLTPFTVTETLAQIGAWMDVLVLGAFAPAAAVGLYGVARGFSRALELILRSAAHRFLPVATSAHSESGVPALVDVYKRVRVVVFTLSWPAMAACLFGAPSLVHVLFGAAYAPAAPILRILAAGYLLECLFGYKDLALIAIGRAGQNAAIIAGVLAVGLVALLALVPGLGAMGAAWAVVAMFVVRIGVLSALLLRQTGIRPWREDLPLPIVLAALPTVAVALLAHGRVEPLTELVLTVAVAAAGSLALLVSALRRRPGLLAGLPWALFR